MRALVLGTAGHVDHGKTSFIRALSGVDCDRLKEEKERSITIELGFASLDLPGGRRLGIVDVPGHEKFVRNMVAGAAGMDLVAFVVAADEGIMPQTVEHFEICRLLGLKDGIIVLSKIDLVDAEWQAMVTAELREFFKGSFLESAPILPVNTQSGEGIAAVRQALAEKVAALPVEEASGPFRLPIDRVFSMKGFGTVITGTALSGRIALGEELCFYPGGLTARIRGIQVHGEARDMAEAGHRTAINVQGLETEDIARGDMAATPGAMLLSRVLDVLVQASTGSSRPLRHRSAVRVHLGTREIPGRVSLVQSEALAPGESGLAQLLLQEVVAAWPGDRFVLRSYSPATTLAGGSILALWPGRKRKRGTEQSRALAGRMLSVYAHGTPQACLAQLVAESGLRGLNQAELAAASGIFGRRLQKLLQEPLARGEIVQADGRLLAGTETLRLQEDILHALAGFHKANPLKTGLGREELKSRLQERHQQAASRLLAQQLAVLERQGKIVQEGGELRLAGHAVQLQVDEAALETGLLARFLEAGLQPPNLKDALALFPEAPEKQVRQVLQLLEQRGDLVRVNETLFFHRDVLAGLQTRLAAFLQEKGEIDAPAFKELTGLSRKFLIPLLEYFDRIKLTIRIGDRRVPRKQSGTKSE